MSSPCRKRKDKLKSKLRYHYGRAIQYEVPAEKITVGQWNEKLRQHDHRCVYCQKSPTKRQRRLTFDHAIPLAKGGTHTIENLVPACLKCNLSKGAKLLENWNGP